MTDKDGNLLWYGEYTGWGRLKEETKVTDSTYQPFRLQNQYADAALQLLQVLRARCGAICESGSNWVTWR